MICVVGAWDMSPPVVFRPAWDSAMVNVSNSSKQGWLLPHSEGLARIVHCIQGRVEIGE